MDFTQKPTNSTPELTAELAMIVYNKIKEAGNADLAYKAQVDSLLEPEWFDIVNKEGDRIINEIMSKENGTFIVEPAYPATYNEDGSIKEEAVPAVYFDASDTNFLINSLTSDLLDVATVYADYNAK